MSRPRTPIGRRATARLLVTFAVVALGAGACRSGEPDPGAAAVPTTAAAGAPAAGSATAAVEPAGSLTDATASTAGVAAASTAGPAAGLAAGSVAVDGADGAATDGPTVAATDVSAPPTEAGGGPVEVRAALDGPVVEHLAAAGIGLGSDAVPDEGEFGVPIALDETALLACAHNEYAMVLRQLGDDAGAARELARSAARAQLSTSVELAAQHGALLTAAAGTDSSEVTASVAALCRANGFRP